VDRNIILKWIFVKWALKFGGPLIWNLVAFNEGLL
jgi:hypothetical protein